MAVSLSHETEIVGLWELKSLLPCCVSYFQKQTYLPHKISLLHIDSMIPHFLIPWYANLGRPMKVGDGIILTVSLTLRK